MTVEGNSGEIHLNVARNIGTSFDIFVIEGSLAYLHFIFW